MSAEPSAVDLFPFPSFRDYQKEALVEAELALWGDSRIDEEVIEEVAAQSGKSLEHFQKIAEDEYHNVVLDLPTGVGKSGINTALCRRSDGAFMTTPQKKLRNQLERDEDLKPHYKPLRARRDYTCGATGKDCDSCPINRDDEKSCVDEPRCTYWNNKSQAMGEHTAVLTFAYLIVDNYLPQMSEEGHRLSFGKRDLLVVDECHSLEDQVASLFAGFSVSPYTIPKEVYRDAARRLSMETNRGTEVRSIMNKLYDRCERFVMDKQDHPEFKDEVDKCESFMQKADYYFEELDEGRDWVVNMKEVSHPTSSGQMKGFELKPVKVDRFLRKYIWRRANKRVLSTATMPYRDEPRKWLSRLGLAHSKTHVVSYPMPFPPANRPVFTNTIIDKMSGGGDEENWGTIMKTINDLSGEHKGENGLIHAASDSRARKFYQSANNGSWDNLFNNVILHERGQDAEEVIEEWNNSDKDIVVTPSMTEGVDLVDNMCRWQVLMKVPYPHPGDSRVDYWLNEKPGQGWPWYYEMTALHIVQSVGRAVRSSTDYASYYVLDESFNDVRDRVNLPEWFEDAIVESDKTISDLTKEMTQEEQSDLMEDMGITDNE